MCWFKKIKKKSLFKYCHAKDFIKEYNGRKQQKKSIILQKGIYHTCFQKTGSHLQKISLTKSDINSHLQLQSLIPGAWEGSGTASRFLIYLSSFNCCWKPDRVSCFRSNLRSFLVLSRHSGKQNLTQCLIRRKSMEPFNCPIYCDTFT